MPSQKKSESKSKDINKHYWTDDQIEEVRTECAKRGQLDLFFQICIMLGREDLEDYVPSESESSDEEEDYETVEMGEEVEETIESQKSEDGFYSLK